MTRLPGRYVIVDNGGLKLNHVQVQLIFWERHGMLFRSQSQLSMKLMLPLTRLCKARTCRLLLSMV